jgi:hypothetical protein
MFVEQSVEWMTGSETGVLGQNLHQSGCGHHRSHSWFAQVSNPGRRGGKAAINRLNYETISIDTQ